MSHLHFFSALSDWIAHITAVMKRSQIIQTIYSNTIHLIQGILTQTIWHLYILFFLHRSSLFLYYYKQPLNSNFEAHGVLYTSCFAPPWVYTSKNNEMYLHMKAVLKWRNSINFSVTAPSPLFLYTNKKKVTKTERGEMKFIFVYNSRFLRYLFVHLFS